MNYLALFSLARLCFQGEHSSTGPDDRGLPIGRDQDLDQSKGRDLRVVFGDGDHDLTEDLSTAERPPCSCPVNR